MDARHHADAVEGSGRFGRDPGARARARARAWASADAGSDTHPNADSHSYTDADSDSLGVLRAVVGIAGVRDGRHARDIQRPQLSQQVVDAR
jgi:hypothetical protein